MTRRERTGRTVKEVADLAGISVRTLHHYDEIGLLVPSARSAKGYRLYRDEDLLRLQQILIGRAMGLPLEAVRRSLDDPRFDLRTALKAQRIALAREADRNARMLHAIDQALHHLDTKGTDPMTDATLFDGFHPHEHEAKARWGDTEAYRESTRRAATYGPDDWAAMKAEQDAIYRDLGAAMRAGRAADHPEVAAIVLRHRASIDRWFYPCNGEMQRGLASLYESDPRFAANIDVFGEGLTTFLVAAIRAC